MATRRESCSRCRAQLVVPWDAQAVSCPVCRSIIRVRHNGGNYFPVADHQYSSSYGYYPTSDYGYYNRQPFRPPVPMSVHGKKRAVLCGISYRGQDKGFLKGSVNDVNCMKYFLTQRMGFPNECILVLTEDEKEESRIPTKHNIRMALRWLVQGIQSGDSLVFHYSGHASKVRDFDGDEKDGYDESLCPLDYETEGKILDDEINATIIRPLPTGAKLHAIIDTCYSGTFLDLPFNCRMNREGYYKWDDQRISRNYKGTHGGLALCFSACDDQQSSGDTTAFTGNSTGAMTYSFIKAVETEPRSTYGSLLSAIRNKVQEAQRGAEVSTAQEPQLSTTEKFDIHEKIFAL